MEVVLYPEAEALPRCWVVYIEEGEDEWQSAFCIGAIERAPGGGYWLARSSDARLRECGTLDRAIAYLRRNAGIGRPRRLRGKERDYLSWVANTLIPDLRESGMIETARDLARCVRIARRCGGAL